MLTITPGNDAARTAVALLRQWDDRMDRGKPEPLIFIAWLREFARVVLADKLGLLFDDYWRLRPEVARSILTEHQDWCPAGPAPGTGCAGALATALDRALDGLRRRYGADMQAWRWGTAHPALFTSAVWANVPVVARWTALAVPADGAEDTVDAGAMDVRDAAAPFEDLHGPTLRMIIDLARPDDARFMITPGQSGNPLSPHWGDLMRPWRDVRYLTFGDDKSGGALTLTPK